MVHIVQFRLEMKRAEVPVAEIEGRLEGRARPTLQAIPARVARDRSTTDRADGPRPAQHPALPREVGQRVPQPVLARIVLQIDHEMSWVVQMLCG